MVEGSGAEQVDGEYLYDDHHEGAPKYIKEQNGIVLTLFRCGSVCVGFDFWFSCVMKDQSKQWYISVCGAKPGDYDS